MPELPEVETVRRALLKKLKGKQIKEITILHNNVFEKQDIEKVKQNIKNQTINDILRRGKWLEFVLDDYYLLSHLRMEGKYVYRNINDPIERHQLVLFNIDNDISLRYRDVRKFGKMYLIKKEDVGNSPISKLGLEPWDDNLDSSYLKEKYKRKNLPIKTVLLDQSIITGIGNIYADEILFLSKINPHKKAKDLETKELQSIIDNTKQVLDKAIDEKGTTIRSYTSEEGVKGNNQNNLYVHMREKEPCKLCKEAIVKEKIGGRGSYYCPNCQGH
ncbi:MAG: DNA-formamidopyrimidine glycosylase [Bacilli bacterium]|nr:DNA-formamidopyrimidine glycosylase [Bacilli bacterium]